MKFEIITVLFICLVSYCSIDATDSHVEYVYEDEHNMTVSHIETTTQMAEKNKINSTSLEEKKETTTPTTTTHHEQDQITTTVAPEVITTDHVHDHDHTTQAPTIAGVTVGANNVTVKIIEPNVIEKGANDLKESFMSAVGNNGYLKKKKNKEFYDF